MKPKNLISEQLRCLSEASDFTWKAIHATEVTMAFDFRELAADRRSAAEFFRLIS